MGVIEKAISWMETTATDNSHGYDQILRWGEDGDYDCSSAVITAWEQAGVPVKSSGATYTGNMYSVFIKNGFKDVTKSVNLMTGSGLQRGDVLLNHLCHTAMYCGNGKEVEASINEFGCVTGGNPGDQTGREFAINNYRNYPWDCVLRYPESKTDAEPVKQEKQKISTEINFYGTVNIDANPEEFLAVRSYAGTEYAQIKSIPKLKAGDVVQVCDTIKDSRGEKWYYVKLHGGILGFVYAAYIKKVTVK